MRKRSWQFGKAVSCVLKIILLGCSAFAPLQLVLAQESAPATTTADGRLHSLWALSVTYDYHATNNLRMFSFGSTSGSDPSAGSASFVGMRTFATLSYRPILGVEVGVHIGSAFASTLTISGTSLQYGTITQTIGLESATMYGGQLRVDFFPRSRLHLTPGFSWRSASLSGTGGTLYNSGGTVGLECNYDYATNGASVCRTLGLNTGGGIAASRLYQTYFSASIEASLDIGANPSSPWLVIHVGAEQGISTLSGTTIYTPPAGTPVSEAVALSGLRTEHVFAGIGTTIDQFRIRANAQFLGDLSFSGQVGYAF